MRSTDHRLPGTATAPAVLELSDSIWLPVIALHDETHDLRTYRVARPMGFDFQPGQSVRVDVPVRGKPHTCRVSISSAPESTAWVEISVKRRGAAARGAARAFAKRRVPAVGADGGQRPLSERAEPPGPEWRS